MDKEKKKKLTFTVLVGLSLALLVTAIIVSVSMSCTTIRSIMKSYPDDNIIEEAVEGVIENQTGLDIDLTPWSREKSA